MVLSARKKNGKRSKEIASWSCWKKAISSLQCREYFLKRLLLWLWKMKLSMPPFLKQPVWADGCRGRRACSDCASLNTVTLHQHGFSVASTRCRYQCPNLTLYILLLGAQKIYLWVPPKVPFITRVRLEQRNNSWEMAFGITKRTSVYRYIFGIVGGCTNSVPQS